MTERSIIVICFSCAVVAVITVVSFALVQIDRNEKEAKVNAQTVIEQTKIQEEAAIQRTKERMNLIPWYKGGENK